MTKKKVSAPLTYNPGKGRPKEHLAYLNEREMAFLRSINGDNMERGPRGLPSFPPDDSLGSDSRNSKAGGGSRGPGGPSGPNSGGSGGLGGGGKGTAGGAPSGSAKASTSPSTKTSSPSPSSVPSSPMSGQGASFSTPSSASRYNADRMAQQKVQVRDTKVAVSNTPAARNDLASGGIRTINVGPMGTPVNVGRPIGGSATFKNPAASDISRSLAQPNKYSSPLTPGMTQQDMMARGALMNRYEQEIRDLMREGVYTRTGDPISAGGGPSTFSVPKTPYSGGAFDPSNEIQQAAIDKAIIGATNARDLGTERTASVPATSSVGMSVEDIVRALTPSPAAAAIPGSIDLRGTGYGTFNVPNVAFENKLRDLMNPQTNVPEAPSPFDEEKILEIENLPPERPTYAAETYTKPYDRPMQNRLNVVGGMGILGVDSPEAEAESSFGDYTAAQREKVYGGFAPGKTRGIGDSYPGADGKTEEDIGGVYDTTPTEGAAVDNPYMSPTTQMPAYPEDTLPMKIAKRAGTIGQLLRLASWADRKMFDRMSPEEQAAAMQRWGERRAVYGRDVGDAQDRSKVPTPPRFGSPAIGGGGGGGKEDSGRPQIYYDWDAGVGIPSPGDSDYTLYLQYLEEKAAAQAAVS